MAKKHSLSVENIDQVAIDFIATKPSYSIKITDCQEGKLKKIAITHNKETGILNCFINGGQVSYSTQGKAHLKGICEECWNVILQNTSIPCPDKKSFTAKGISEEDFDAFIDVLSESDEIEITTVNTDNNPAIRNQYHLKGKYDAKVSIIFYNNGTLFLQGAVTAFYIELITEIMETISSVPTEVMEDFLAIQPLVGCVIEKDLNKHFTKTENIEGSILEDFLKTSIALANSGVVVDDYGCYTFGIMKALDGLISKRLLEDAPDFKDYGTYFERGKDGNYHFLENVGTYNGNPSLKRALEKAYDFYNKNRHTTFHIDRRNLETSRTLYYDEAVNIIKDGLVIINDLCTNGKEMKTKDYQIISLGERSFLVVVLSLEMTDYYWTALQSELAKYNVADAEVYFDFLYRNGLKNRFFKTKLMGVSLLNNSLRKCKATQECISASDKFFTLHKDVIEHSVLSSIQKTFFRKKLDRTNILPTNVL